MERGLKKQRVDSHLVPLLLKLPRDIIREHIARCVKVRFLLRLTCSKLRTILDPVDKQLLDILRYIDGNKTVMVGAPNMLLSDTLCPVDVSSILGYNGNSKVVLCHPRVLSVGLAAWGCFISLDDGRISKDRYAITYQIFLYKTFKSYSADVIELEEWWKQHQVQKTRFTFCPCIDCHDIVVTDIEADPNPYGGYLFVAQEVHIRNKSACM